MSFRTQYWTHTSCSDTESSPQSTALVKLQLRSSPQKTCFP
jgi:hypothetical protein